MNRFLSPSSDLTGALNGRRNGDAAFPEEFNQEHFEEEERLRGNSRPYMLVDDFAQEDGLFYESPEEIFLRTHPCECET